MQSDTTGFRSLFNLLYFLTSAEKYLFLDEPERFLHPSLRRTFTTLAARLASHYGKQIFIATHSPELVRFDLQNVIVTRLHDDPTVATDVTAFANADTTPRAFRDWFLYNPDITFASRVVLVERRETGTQLVNDN